MITQAQVDAGVAALQELKAAPLETTVRAILEAADESRSVAEGSEYMVVTPVDQEGLRGWLEQAGPFTERALAYEELERIRKVAAYTDFGPELFFVAARSAASHWERDDLEKAAVLTSTAAAELLGVSRSTLMKLVRDGAVPAKHVGAHYQFDRKVIEDVARTRSETRARAFKELRAWEEEHGGEDEPQ